MSPHVCMVLQHHNHKFLRFELHFSHPTNKMSNRSESASFQAGEAKGQVKAKADELVDKAKDACQSAKESCAEAGGQIKAKAEGAVQAVKDATGMNK